MADQKTLNDITQRLGRDISDEVGNSEESEIQMISNDFDKILTQVIGSFNSINFDKDGFLVKLQDMDLTNKSDKDTLKKILGNLKNDYTDATSINNSDMMLKRDITNICQQMPEMRDVVYIVRDAIIESDAVTGGVSRNISFSGDNDETNETKRTIVEDMEEKYNLQLAIKNFCIIQTLRVGEMYINVIPYKKLFAELDAIHQRKMVGKITKEPTSRSKSPEEVRENSLYNLTNLNYLKESLMTDTKWDVEADYQVEKNSNVVNIDSKVDGHLKLLLENITVHSSETSILMSEIGDSGLEEFLKEELKNKPMNSSQRSFFEDVMLGKIAEEDIDFNRFKDIKGCYIKYLDPLKMLPIRLDRKVIGYYYVTTNMDLQMNPTQPSGIVDLSFQHYAKDRNLVANLAQLIIRSFDKKMLDKNIKLKAEIAEIIMEHKFNESRLSFLYIPESEVIRLVVNEDETGKGHSIIEPSLFPARMYLMLTLFNMIYTLNNNVTRVHYLRSSGLNKDYAAQMQKAIRKFQSRRITIDDIYSYSGVLNKVGGIGEMVLPSGRGGDFKAIETDTIAPAENPISLEFLEMLRRQAISGTGVPALLIINALDEVDFAKTLEMANTRFLSAVTSYKIDFNKGFTKLYQLILKYTSELTDVEIGTFRFKFNAVRQSTLDITNNMIQNFNTLYETIGSIYFNQQELQDADGKPTDIALALKREMAEEYLPHLNYDLLDKLVKRVRVRANEQILNRRVQDHQIEEEELDDLKTNKAKETEEV